MTFKKPPSFGKQWYRLGENDFSTWNRSGERATGFYGMRCMEEGWRPRFLVANRYI